MISSTKQSTPIMIAASIGSSKTDGIGASTLSTSNKTSKSSKSSNSTKSTETVAYSLKQFNKQLDEKIQNYLSPSKQEFAQDHTAHTHTHTAHPTYPVLNSGISSRCSSYASLYEYATPISSGRSTPLQFHIELGTPEPEPEECKTKA